MRLFISWSKKQSRELATALQLWLPEVIQEIDPWMSDEDIDKGQRWSEELHRQLQDTNQAIICVTAKNQSEPWLNFEAGALAKSLDDARVRPLLYKLEREDLSGPLSTFQLTACSDKTDMLKLVRSLNNSCSSPLTEERLQRAFDRTWDEFYNMASSIAEEEAPPQRSADDMLREVVGSVRTLLRRTSDYSTFRTRPEFRKSSFNAADKTGVEVAFFDDTIVVRDGKAEDRSRLVYTTEEWDRFVRSVKAGEFDFD